MTLVSDDRRAERVHHLESLLPVHVLQRDAESGGLLRDLIEAFAGELAIIEEDLEQLADSLFIETAPEWAIPYIADLVGLVGLPDDLGRGTSRRRVVANTVAYRQRKGTVGVLEQVVHDVTGWPAKAVEFYRLLATTTHVNHVRPERPAWASLRRAATVEVESTPLLAGVLGRFAHTADIRRLGPGTTRGRGRYNIPNIGVFVFPLQVFEAFGVPARKTADGWASQPLGCDEPWFARPSTEDEIEHLATEDDLPVPLRPRRLLALLAAARAGVSTELPILVSIDRGDALTPDRIRVCGLEDLATEQGAPLTGWQVMVDPVRGLLRTYADGHRSDPDTLHLDYSYGAMDGIGAGVHDRSGQDDIEDAQVVAQVHVQTSLATRTGPPSTARATVQDALATVEAGWPSGPLGSRRPAQIISIGDSEAYAGDLVVTLPTRTRLVIVAAEWPAHQGPNGVVSPPTPGRYIAAGLRPRLTGDLLITGAAGSTLRLDGLTIEGDIRVEAGGLSRLELDHCTVTGRIVQSAGGSDQLTVRVRECRLGGVLLAAAATELDVEDCTVDANGTPAVGPPAAITAPSVTLTVAGSTILGDAECRILMMTSSICDGVMTAIDRQRGCARFSYFGEGSRTPRRFRCAPATNAGSAVTPSYLATDLGSPFYAVLSPSTPDAIRRGGEFGAEMGVHHHLRRPLRMDAALRLVAPYVPVGMHVSIIGS